MQSRDSADRQALGWIAVSGEDDTPHHPVNVPPSKFPQYEIVIHIARGSGYDIHTRFIVAQTYDVSNIPNASGHVLAADSVPRLSDDAEVFLYVHGQDSRAEEAEQMAEELIALGRSEGRNYALISMDMPGSGYADRIDSLAYSAITDIGNPKASAACALGIVVFPVGAGVTCVAAGVSISNEGLSATDLDFDTHDQHTVPVLDLNEDFVVNFVNALDPIIDLKRHLRAVVGGSLGGNIALRLGRRNLSWLPAVIAWSPGSVWTHSQMERIHSSISH